MAFTGSYYLFYGWRNNYGKFYFAFYTKIKIMAQTDTYTTREQDFDFEIESGEKFSFKQSAKKPFFLLLHALSHGWNFIWYCIGKR